MQTEINEYTMMIYIDSPSYDLELSSKYTKTLLSQFFSKFCSEISPEEFIVLETISTHRGLCQRDLAKLILKDRANTGRIVESLSNRGFVTRHNDTKNNRLVRKVVITDKGEFIIKELRTRFQPYHEKMCKLFNNEELLVLKRSLKKFRDAVSQIVEIQI